MGRATAVAGCLALAALGLAVAGCGSSSPEAASGTTTGATTAGGAARSAAFAAYQSCLKAHGVALPRFGGFRGQRPPTGTNAQRRPAAPTGTNARGLGGFRGFARNLTAKQRAALTACRSKLPSGAFAGGRRFGGGPGGSNGSNPGFARYTSCLKRHGVAFGSTSSSPAVFRKAQAACASLRPAAARAPTTTGSS